MSLSTVSQIDSSLRVRLFIVSTMHRRVLLMVRYGLSRNPLSYDLNFKKAIVINLMSQVFRELRHGKVDLLGDYR
jgi:hypothetical protein